MGEPEIEKIREQIGTWSREDFHDFREILGATVTAIAVIQERQKSIGEQSSRIESLVTETRDYTKQQNGRLGAAEKAVAVLEARAEDAKFSGQRWGAGTGSLAGFLGGMLGGFIQHWTPGAK